MPANQSFYPKKERIMTDNITHIENLQATSPTEERGGPVILVINPGATSTKLAIYEGDKAVWMSGAHHPAAELVNFHHSMEQYEYRMAFIRKRLADAGIPVRFDAVIGRGGLLKPLPGGVYHVNELMKHDLVHAEMDHVCNLGALLADELARECGCPAFIADPVVVDEMQEVARYTGMPGIRRKSVFHALNSKAMARQYASSVGRRYEDINLIVAHMGGGISVSAHRKGRVVDVNNALDGEGPFSTERAGTLPAGQLVDMCFSGKYSVTQIKKMIHGRGGLTAYTGTNDMITIARDAEEGEEPCRTVLDAMLYTVAKQIGAMHVCLHGEEEAIIITGGIAHSNYCMERLRRQIEFLAPVVVMPGENEVNSLAYNALCALTGSVEVKEYGKAHVGSPVETE